MARRFIWSPNGFHHARQDARPSRRSTMGPRSCRWIKLECPTIFSEISKGAYRPSSTAAYITADPSWLCPRIFDANRPGGPCAIQKPSGRTRYPRFFKAKAAGRKMANICDQILADRCLTSSYCEEDAEQRSATAILINDLPFFLETLAMSNCGTRPQPPSIMRAKRISEDRRKCRPSTMIHRLASQEEPADFPEIPRACVTACGERTRRVPPPPIKPREQFYGVGFTQARQYLHHRLHRSVHRRAQQYQRDACLLVHRNDRRTGISRQHQRQYRPADVQRL